MTVKSKRSRGILAAVAAGAVFTTGSLLAPAAQAEEKHAGVAAEVSEDVHQQLLDALNQYRESKGVAAVTEDAVMHEQAQNWADHLAATGNLEQDALDTSSGVFAQNLAIGLSAANITDVVFNQWAKDPRSEHHLVNPDHTKVGYGVAIVKTGPYAGQPVVVQKLGH